MLKAIEKAKALKEFKELRLKLGGELSALEKAKSIKRFRELRVLLGGQNQDEPTISIQQRSKHYEEVIKRLIEIAKFNKNTSTFSFYGGQVDPLEEQAHDAWIYYKFGLSFADNNWQLLLWNDSKNVENAGNYFIPADYLVAGAQTADIICNKALSLRNDIQQASNPLFQSVIDGAEITVDLIEQLKAEAEKDLAHPQLRPAVNILVEKVKALAAIQGAA